MGIEIHCVWQVLQGTEWQDIESGFTTFKPYGKLLGIMGSEFNPLGITPISEPRGFPDGFVVLNDHFHPIPLESCTDYERQNVSVDNRPQRWMGEWGFSWLTGKEMLEWYVTNQDTEVKYFFDEVKRLSDLHGEIRLVFGFDS